jgi:hypothetical protein
MEVHPVNSAQNQDGSSTAALRSRCTLYLAEGVGWIGSVLVLIPYVAPLDRTTDFALNTLGASGLFIVCLASRQYQSVIINAAWVIGGFYKYFS